MNGGRFCIYLEDKFDLLCLEIALTQGGGGEEIALFVLKNVRRHNVTPKIYSSATPVFTMPLANLNHQDALPSHDFATVPQLISPCQQQTKVIINRLIVQISTNNALSGGTTRERNLKILNTPLPHLLSCCHLKNYLQKFVQILGNF